MFDWFVPPAARGNPKWHDRHVAVAKSLLSISLTVLGLLAAYLTVRNRPTTAEMALFAAGIVIPVLGTLLIRVTGRILHGLVLTNLAGILLVSLWAYLTGGILSAVVPWLLANFALLSTFGNLPVLTVAGSVLAAAVLLLYFATARHWLPASIVPDALLPEITLLAMLSSVALVVFTAAMVLRERANTKVRLREARDIAERASRAKSVFLSSVSHELRTPLSAVIGFAEVLKHDQADPLSHIQGTHVDHILTAGDHLLGLVNQMIEMSRIEAGEVDLRIENIRLGEIIGESVAMVDLAAAKRGIAIDNQFRDSAGLLVRADATRLRQVLINLLSNAVKYNLEGGRISVSVRLVEHTFVRIAVTDTGKGIAAARHGELFQSFARLGYESGPTQGSGLGLVISKRLIEMMDGRIGFDSAEGAGSTFWVELPPEG